MGTKELENLVRIGRLHQQPPDRTFVRKLLDAARRTLADAGNESLSPETRFDAAYNAAFRAALAALAANGFRPATSTPGHHQTTIQSLVHTIDYPRESMVILDAIRQRRNGIDYSGDIVSEEMVRECIEQSTLLVASVDAWIAENRKELV